MENAKNNENKAFLLLYMCDFCHDADEWLGIFTDPKLLYAAYNEAEYGLTERFSGDKHGIWLKTKIFEADLNVMGDWRDFEQVFREIELEELRKMAGIREGNRKYEIWLGNDGMQFKHGIVRYEDGSEETLFAWHNDSTYGVGSILVGENGREDEVEDYPLRWHPHSDVIEFYSWEGDIAEVTFHNEGDRDIYLSLRLPEAGRKCRLYP